MLTLWLGRKPADNSEHVLNAGDIFPSLKEIKFREAAEEEEETDPRLSWSLMKSMATRQPGARRSRG